MTASSADGVSGSLYEKASDLHRRGRPEEAIPLLRELLGELSEDVGGRYALGVCLTDAGKTSEVQAPFRRVLDIEPTHYQAAYRLGRLLQADADPAGAAAAYRQVLSAVPEFRDTAARLRACGGAPDATRATTPGGAPPPGMPPPPSAPPPGMSGPGMAPSGMPVTGRAFAPGPPTLRAQSDAHRVAERG
ncbi:tetratricopeptide repeat protein [Streptomyces sp. NPDC020719]|uniref:tetratricopeptide repeat protein n=1 Tax=Streptomyces sp. NPDC020719 TaxID=3154896 RepID=UPI0033D072D2